MFPKFDIENNTHQCKQCGMKFYNSFEFFNHNKKFCMGQGLNTVQGLVQYKITNVFKDQLKSYGEQSLGLRKHQPTQIQRLPINRPYTEKRNARYWGTESKGNLKENNEIGEGPLIKFGKSTRRPLTNKQNNFNRLISRDQPNFNQKQNSASPSSIIGGPFAKRAFQTVLNKSHDSIAQMSLSQRKYYAEEKLIQLRNIEDMYDQSGGASMDFRRKLQKMRQFYRKMLQDQQTAKKYPGYLVESKVQSIFNHAKDNDHIKNYPADSLDKQIITKIANKKVQSKQRKNNSKMCNTFMSYPHPYPPYCYQQPKPQIIMIPPYLQQQQPLPQQNNQVLKQQTNYYRNIIQRKNQQNKQLIRMIMQAKKQEQPQEKQNVSKNKEKVKPLYLESPMDETLEIEQKILLALQRQQLDQLKLFANLPEQLQQLRMQAITKLTQQRIQLEKQILQQKVKRLQQQERNQLYEEQVRFQKDEWANEKRKKLILHQMGDVLYQFNQKISGDNQNDDEEEEEEGEENEDDHQQGNKQNYDNKQQIEQQ